MPERITAGPVSIPRIDGWDDRTMLTMVGPNTEGAQPNVVVTREALCDNLGLGGFSSGWMECAASPANRARARARRTWARPVTPPTPVPAPPCSW